MTGFLVAAALLTAAALAFVLIPLLRPEQHKRASVRAVNLSIYRDQFTELERDLKLGTIDAAQYENARAELERRLLDEAAPRSDDPAPDVRSRSAGWTALGIGIGVPLCAGLLYWHLGQPQGIGAPKHAAQDPASITQADFEAMTQKLAQRMAANPDDAVGWLMLGKAYLALERIPEAVDALKEAERRQPNEPEVLIEYAEALALAHGRSFEGEPARLLQRALKIDPNQPKALTMAGAAAFAAKDYKRAVDYWERLQKQLPADSELSGPLATGIAQARELAGMKPAVTAAAGAEAIRGEVRLADAVKARAAPEDTLFVVARAADGPRMPLAVVRRQVKDLPLTFTLDDSMAMAPQMRLSGFSNVIVTARVSKSGEATPRSGDLEGTSAPVRPGASGVAITIDSVVQ